MTDASALVDAEGRLTLAAVEAGKALSSGDLAVLTQAASVLVTQAQNSHAMWAINTRKLAAHLMQLADQSERPGDLYLRSAAQELKRALRLNLGGSAVHERLFQHVRNAQAAIQKAVAVEERAMANKTMTTGDATSVGFGVADDATEKAETPDGSPFKLEDPVTVISQNAPGKIKGVTQTETGHFVYKVTLSGGKGLAVCTAQDLAARSVRSVKDRRKAFVAAYLALKSLATRNLRERPVAGDELVSAAAKIKRAVRGGDVPNPAAAEEAIACLKRAYRATKKGPVKALATQKAVAPHLKAALVSLKAAKAVNGLSLLQQIQRSVRQAQAVGLAPDKARWAYERWRSMLVQAAKEDRDVARLPEMRQLWRDLAYPGVPDADKMAQHLKKLRTLADALVAKLSATASTKSAKRNEMRHVVTQTVNVPESTKLPKVLGTPNDRQGAILATVAHSLRDKQTYYIQVTTRGYRRVPSPPSQASYIKVTGRRVEFYIYKLVDDGKSAKSAPRLTPDERVAVLTATIRSRLGMHSGQHKAATQPGAFVLKNAGLLPKACAEGARAIASALDGHRLPADTEAKVRGLTAYRMATLVAKATCERVKSDSAVEWLGANA